MPSSLSRHALPHILRWTCSHLLFTLTTAEKKKNQVKRNSLPLLLWALAVLVNRGGRLWSAVSRDVNDWRMWSLWCRRYAWCIPRTTKHHRLEWQPSVCCFPVPVSNDAFNTSCETNCSSGQMKIKTELEGGWQQGGVFIASVFPTKKPRSLPSLMYTH